MRILVLSDSHSTLSVMRRWIDAVKPNAIVHLGDYYEDAQSVREEYPHIPFYMVPGNCDRFRSGGWEPEIRIEQICGVTLYLTHGHRHGVKQTRARLLADARAAMVDGVLYGHTHQADCYEEDGLWVLNPGSCGYFGGSVGLIETEDGAIQSCRVLDDRDYAAFAEKG